MPELPEVETVRLGLVESLLGQTFRKVEVFDVRSLRRNSGGVDSFVAALIGRRISGVVRRGKFLWFELCGLDGGILPYVLLAHLGMSGQLLVQQSSAVFVKHLKISFDFGGCDFLQLRFVDQRVFGSLAVVPVMDTVDSFCGGNGSDRQVLPVQIGHVARDVLDKNFDVLAWKILLSKKNVVIKTVLLDQRVLSGVGNIYADEALWKVGIYGGRLAASLSEQEKDGLFVALGEVMLQALGVGGTSFDSLYVNVGGESGGFVDSLRVYGRSGLECFRCGGVILREKLGGRSCHFCAVCQK